MDEHRPDPRFEPPPGPTAAPEPSQGFKPYALPLGLLLFALILYLGSSSGNESVGEAAPPVVAISEWIVPEDVDALPYEESIRPGAGESKGKVIVLEFYATWCPPCVASHRRLDELAPEWASKGVHVVGVTSLDGRQTREQIRGYAEERKFTTALVSGATLQAYGVRTIPMAAVIGKQGKIAWSGNPFGSEAAMVAAVEASLAD